MSIFSGLLRGVITSAALSLAASYSALAGPPLVTDDTGIVPKGDWQFIVSIQGESRPSTESAAAPAVEATFGFWEDMNLTAVIPRQLIEDRGEPSKTGLGNAQLNYKWLFFDDDKGLTMAISPIYSFPLTKTSRIRGLAEDVRVLSMPVLISKEIGSWQFLGSAAYDLASQSVDGVSYGAFVLYNQNERLQWMAEVYGAQFSGDEFDNEGFLNWRVGAWWLIGKGFSLLAAYGGPLQSDLPSDDKLDYDFFFGFQFDTELAGGN